MANERITRTYTISSQYPELLDKLEQMFKYMEFLSNIGASRKIIMFIDGDGRADLKFDSKDGFYGEQDKMIHDKMVKQYLEVENSGDAYISFE